MRSPWSPLSLFVALVLYGCSGACDTSGQEPIRFADGLTNDARSLYQTTLPDGEYLHFPAGRRYDLVHGLGSVPAAVHTTLSFDVAPLARDGDDDTSSVAEGAGNLVVIERQTDTFVRVRNDTCAEMYLRVVATAE